MGTSIVEPTVSQDIPMMEEVRKPALLRSLFMLGSGYSGQELSFTKMLGQLNDAGNTVTLAHYLDLLGKARACLKTRFWWIFAHIFHQICRFEISYKRALRAQM